MAWRHVSQQRFANFVSISYDSTAGLYTATHVFFMLQVFTTMQDAMGLVHMYPFLPDAMEYMDCIASLHGLPDTLQEPVTQADWDALLAYCAKVTAADHFHYVPLLQGIHHGAQATPAAAFTSSHLAVAANQTPSPVQRSVHFSPDSVLAPALLPGGSSQSYSGNHSLQHSPSSPQPASPHHPHLQSAGSQALPSLGQSQMVLSLELSRQGSSQLDHTQAPERAPSWVSQPPALQHAPLPARHDQSYGRLSSHNQYQMLGPMQPAGQFPDQGLALPAHGYASSHANGASLLRTPNSLGHVPLEQGQILQVEGGRQVFVSQAPVQMMYSSPALQGHVVSQGMIHQGHVIQGRGADHLPAWLGQNLAYTLANPVVQSAPNGRMHSPTPMQAASYCSQGPNPKAVYPTAAMRSQQLSQQTQHGPSIASVKAPLAPFVNEQLKRMLAEGGPSGRRGF